MGWIPDEIWFYGGIAAAIISLLGEIVCLCVFKIKMLRLNLKLDQEYGDCKGK